MKCIRQGNKSKATGKPVASYLPLLGLSTSVGGSVNCCSCCFRYYLHLRKPPKLISKMLHALHLIPSLGVRPAASVPWRLTDGNFATSCFFIMRWGSIRLALLTGALAGWSVWVWHLCRVRCCPWRSRRGSAPAGETADAEAAAHPARPFVTVASSWQRAVAVNSDAVQAVLGGLRVSAMGSGGWLESC